MGKIWTRGRGKLGFMKPLLGSWLAQAESPMGPVRCTRVFEPILNGACVRLTAHWKIGAAASKPKAVDRPAGGGYEELALIGVNADGSVGFWSFTSDGKRSEGSVTDATDLHAEAIGFQAQMPAGIARMVYWPDDDKGFVWVVESKTAKGWRRFVEHHYRPA